MTDKRLLGHARGLRRQQTDAELRLWYHFRAGRFLGCKFRRQKPIGPFIVDFVCMDSAVIVELDGGQHLEQAAYDAKRTGFLESHGFKVLRFWNDEVLTQTDVVLEQVRLAIEAQALSLDPSPASGRGKTKRHRNEKAAVVSSPLPPTGEGLGERVGNEKHSL